MMAVAIAISVIAAWYSIAGLIAIFSAAALPVTIMGGALEAGKIVATVWLHNNWGRSGLVFKAYLIPAIAILMIITSMGTYGYLAKAHSDQGLVAGDAISKVAIYDEKIAVEKSNIDQAKRAIDQMNSQVDQMLSRTDSETGAQRAVNIRKQQAKERAALQDQISQSQKQIAILQEERAPYAAELRKIESEVGPIRYIAALIYGDHPDQTMLERAVRWVIILIVIVFDPLALCLVLAANKQFEWSRKSANSSPKKEEVANIVTETQPEIPNEPPSNEDEFFDKAKYAAQVADILDEQNRASQANDEISELEKEDEIELEVSVVEPVKSTDEPELIKVDDETKKIASLYVPKDEDIAAYNGERLVSKFDKESLVEEEKSVEVVTIIEDTPPPLEEPQETTNEAELDEFNTPIRRGRDPAVRYQGKVYNIEAFNALYPNLAIAVDGKETENCGFGDTFPSNPTKGDLFIRTDFLPDRLYKWNGVKWIEIDKKSTDSYTYNQAYINHIIEKLERGEYDWDDLSDSERAQVEEQVLANKNVQ